MFKRKVFKFLFVVGVASVIVNIAAFSFVLPGGNAFNPLGQEAGGVRVRVKDAISGEVLVGATVCVPEIEGYFKTDSQGYTAVINVPILRDEGFDNSVPQGWGEITLLVYKNGYVDYIIFHIMVKPNTLREISGVTLYPTTTPDDNALHTIIESPDNSWAKEVRDKFKK